MSSTFSGVSVALSALYAQRSGLDVTGQNIANANTVGYSRQRVDLASVGGPTVPGIFSVWSGAGAGVQVADIARMRDQLLETRAREQHGQSALVDGRTAVMSSLEQGLGEPGDSGLQALMADTWSAWHDVANNPGDLAARGTLLQRAAAVAGRLNDLSGAIATEWSTTRQQLDTVASDVNTTAQTIAQLNQAVIRANAGGLPANELTDQRDVLVLHISELTGATARAGADGRVDVFLGGSSLVSGATSRAVHASGPGRLVDVAGQPAALSWVDNGLPASVPAGQVGSMLESLNNLLPGFSAQLDGVAATLASTVNAQQQAGFDLGGAAGGPFFTGTTAAGIAVAFSDPALVAASGSPGGNLDGSNALLMGRLSDTPGGPDRLYRQVVAELGVQSQSAQAQQLVQNTVTQDVDAAREGQSGVNLDEEMTNMLTFQRAYEAASKVLNAIDSMLDTLINHTGV
ncbi:MAG: flagellar hook-associated protein FlgK [Pseudonocardiales bacterium]|nr:MAG: flagellar hook-associated protein FlgK [Pseudonocardiales bacterium]